tara:strand:+ start:90 stop:770 length:681 start_codon:yes stop_codon:yes gene_type:complete
MPRIIKPSTGAFTSTSLSVDSSGRVYSASSGAGAAMFRTTLKAVGGQSGTYTAKSNSTKALVFIAGGGGGGSGTGGPGSGSGGSMTYGTYFSPAPSPTSWYFSAGNGGNGGGRMQGSAQCGQDGQASNFGQPAIVTANGANRGCSPPDGSGNAGNWTTNAPSNTVEYSGNSSPVGQGNELTKETWLNMVGAPNSKTYSEGGSPSNTGQAGGQGVICIWEDAGADGF